MREEAKVVCEKWGLKVTWVKLDDGFPEHPKVLGLSDAAFRLHVLSICYAARNLTDGVIPLAWVTGTVRSLQKALPTLIAAGLWRRRVDGTLEIHDYLEYQPSREEVQAGRNELSRIRAITGANGGKQKAINAASKLPSKTNSLLDTRASKLPSKTNSLLDTRASKTLAPSRLDPGSLSVPNERDLMKSDPSGASAPFASPSSAPLLVSPKVYARAREYCAFVGARLQVPNKLHDDLRRALGGDNPEACLQRWYAGVDEEIERTGEGILPDVWKWLELRFRAWAQEQAADAELEKYRPRPRGA